LVDNRDGEREEENATETQREEDRAREMSNASGLSLLAWAIVAAFVAASLVEGTTEAQKPIKQEVAGAKVTLTQGGTILSAHSIRSS
jgi:hypothetical protein